MLAAGRTSILWFTIRFHSLSKGKNRACLWARMLGARGRRRLGQSTRFGECQELHHRVLVDAVARGVALSLAADLDDAALFEELHRDVDLRVGRAEALCDLTHGVALAVLELVRHGLKHVAGAAMDVGLAVRKL